MLNQLKKTVKKAYILLKNGDIKDFNEWIMKEGIILKLQGVDLVETRLLDIDLRDADLRGADLRGADMWNAILVGQN